ncbi:hypothetical protein [Qipengyuania sediminis]|uniref:hypothetical protein n=1 Tax=Qipengyuania sediminis TaxID=1532023 RepID=UPI00105A45ED|nr:hypothetical protein [Qipengyuania sediminis]
MKFVAVFAFLALAAPTAAMAQQRNASCISEAEVSAMMTYVAPSVIRSVTERCGPRLGETSFLAREGEALAARFAAMQDARWPLAKTALLKFAGNGRQSAGADLDALARLPDNAVRPMVEAIVNAEVTKGVKPADCANIDRGLQLLAGIQTEKVGDLNAFAMAMAGPKNPSICPQRTDANGANERR